MPSPQSQEARQSDRQARTLRITLIVCLVVVAVAAAAILWWPAGTPTGDAASAPAPEAPPTMMASVGEALKDQGTISGYTVAEADKALDLTLVSGAPEDARAVAQATCDTLRGKIDAGWRVRVYAPEGGSPAADCAV